MARKPRTRTDHRLRSNKSCRAPNHWLFFDCETYPVLHQPDIMTHHLRLGVAMYWRRRTGRDTRTYHTFRSPTQFGRIISACLSSRTRLYIVAHNISFDAGVVGLWAILSGLGFAPGKVIIEHGRNVWEFRRPGNSIVVIDTLNYFQASLKQLGESVDCPKSTMPSLADTDDAWERYCRNDVKITYLAIKSWLDFIRVNNLGNFAHTLAGQAFNAFRHRFMACDIYIHARQDVIDLERQSYRGGRVECYQLGDLDVNKAPYYMLDVNSLYPHVMRNNAYPCRLDTYYRRSNLDEYNRRRRGRLSIGRCVLNTPIPWVGVKYKGRLCFPTGTFEAVLCQPEIDYAIAHGYLLDVLEWSAYTPANLFSDYIDHFHRLRLEYKAKGNKVYAYASKLLLNSLYGRFGMRIRPWIDCDDLPPADNVLTWEEHNDNGENRQYRSLEGQAQYRGEYVEGYDSFVAVASFVAAYGRMHLHTLIDRVKPNVYYCDTDSLLVDRIGYNTLEALIDPDRLGALKVERVSHKVVINGCKDYVMDDVVKIKGVSGRAVQTADSTYRQWQSISTLGAMRRGNLNRCEWRLIEKHLSRDYAKGHHDTTTGAISPLILPES